MADAEDSNVLEALLQVAGGETSASGPSNETTRSSSPRVVSSSSSALSSEAKTGRPSGVSSSSSGAALSSGWHVVSVAESPDLSKFDGVKYFVEGRIVKLKPGDTVSCELTSLGRPTFAQLQRLMDAAAAGPAIARKEEDAADLHCPESFPYFMLLDELKSVPMKLSSSALSRDKSNPDILFLTLPMKDPQLAVVVSRPEPPGAKPSATASKATATSSASSSAAPAATAKSAASKSNPATEKPESTSPSKKTSSSSRSLAKEEAPTKRVKGDATAAETSRNTLKDKDVKSEQKSSKGKDGDAKQKAGEASSSSGKVKRTKKGFTIEDAKELPVWGTTPLDEACRCIRSHCLKRYCTCFAKQVHCCAACTCHECLNTRDHLTEWGLAYKRFIENKAEAEKPIFCRCNSTTLCLKRYCECFNAGRYCTDACSCINCGNRPGARIFDTAMPSAQDASTKVEVSQSSQEAYPDSIQDDLKDASQESEAGATQDSDDGDDMSDQWCL